VGFLEGEEGMGRLGEGELREGGDGSVGVGGGGGGVGGVQCGADQVY